MKHICPDWFVSFLAETTLTNDKIVFYNLYMASPQENRNIKQEEVLITNRYIFAIKRKDFTEKVGSKPQKVLNIEFRKMLSK